MKISVAIAAYNGEKYIRDLLDSLSLQTRLPDEIIISDDSSNSLTKNVVGEYLVNSKSSSFIKYFHNDVRFGLVKNFSRAISLCSGDFIFLADQDDYWLPKKIEEMLDLFVSHPDALLAFCDSMYCDSNLKPLHFTNFQMLHIPEDYVRQINDRHSFLLFPSNFSAGHNLVIRKEALSLLLPLPTLFISHDTFITSAISFLEKIVCTSTPLTLHRVHGNSTSDTKKILRYKKSFWGKFRTLTTLFFQHVGGNQYNDLKKSKRWLSAVIKLAESRLRKEHVTFPEENLAYLHEWNDFYSIRLHFFEEPIWKGICHIFSVSSRWLYKKHASGCISQITDCYSLFLSQK